jgi:hypothetical protein
MEDWVQEIIEEARAARAGTPPLALIYQGSRALARAGKAKNHIPSAPTGLPQPPRPPSLSLSML